VKEGGYGGVVGRSKGNKRYMEGWGRKRDEG